MAFFMLIGALLAALAGFDALNGKGDMTPAAGWALIGLAGLLIVCATALIWRNGEDEL